MIHRAAATHPIDLADGRMLAPGQSADIDPAEPHHRILVDAGLLIPIAPRTPPAPPKSPIPPKAPRRAKED